MDWARGQISRRLSIAAAALLGLAGAVWFVLPDGRAARVERRADCTDAASLPPVERIADGRRAVRLRLLLWNVEGLPWPIRSGRGGKLAQMADWIATRRAAGQGPDILILHKAFTPDASRLAIAGGYRSIIPGPARDARRLSAGAPPPHAFAEGARWTKGEMLGKWLDSGLYIANDLPVVAARAEPFGRDSCGGYDCLANKGGLAVRVAIPGAPEPLLLFSTHRNSREPAGVSLARAETAHRLQTRENDRLLADFAAGGREAMIAAGDFNTSRAGDRSGTFARDAAFRLVDRRGDGPAARIVPMADPAAWTHYSDLVGFRNGAALTIEPLAVTPLFDGKNGPRLADHDALYVIFRLSWSGDAAALPPPLPRCTA